MSNSIAPGSSANVNVRVNALTTNPNVPVTYKTIILKKNLVNGVNTLTQEMMSATNTKYVVKYDYVLGENITIPSNCILEFDGGSVNGTYTVTGNNTGINAGLVKIFNTDITLAGTWSVAEAYPEWFGAKGDGITDDTIAIQNCLFFSYCFRNLKCLFTKTYLITDTIYVPCKAAIIGNNWGNYSYSTPTFIANLSNPEKIAFDSDIYSDEECTTRFNSEYRQFRQVPTIFYAKVRQSAWYVENIVIKSENFSLMAFRMINSCNGRFKNVYIYGFRIGMYYNYGWMNNISNVQIRNVHFGMYLLSVTSDVISNVQICDKDTTQSFSNVEKTYFDHIDHTGERFYEYDYITGKTVALFCRSTSVILDSVTAEAIDFGFIFEVCDILINKPYWENIHNRILCIRVSDVVVFSPNGSITEQLNPGYSMVSNTSKLEMHAVADNDKKLPVYFNETIYPYQAAIEHKGTTANRCIVSRYYKYFDTDINKPIYAKMNDNGKDVDRWTEADGATAGVNRLGTFLEKPSVSDIYEGFRYFCTDRSLTGSQDNGTDFVYSGNGRWLDITGTIRTYNLTLNLTNMYFTISTSFGELPENGEEFRITIRPKSGYSYPSTIEVTMGGTTLVLGTDYIYPITGNSAGRLIIYGSGGTGGVTGDIVVTAAGVQN